MNKSVGTHNRGFTIVELLIVVVIIAILAAITIVAYNGIQNRAYNSTIESDLANMAKQMEISKTYLGRYPYVSAEFAQTGFKISKNAYETTVNNMMYCVNKPNDQYVILVVSKSKTRYVLNTGTIVKDTTATSGNSACALIGATWANDMTSATLHGYNKTTGLWITAWTWTA